MAALPNRLGHRSEAAFARAFKRVIGVAPGSIIGRCEGLDAGEPPALGTDAGGGELGEGFLL